MELITRKEAKNLGLMHYYTGIPCSKGHITQRRSDTCVCAECQRNGVRKWYKNTRPKKISEYNAKARVTAQRLRKNNPVCLLLAAAKRRAKIAGLEFNITHEDLQVPAYCPVLGIPLLISQKRQCDNSPSVDRIDNSKGYIKGNVRVVSWRINQRKSDMSIKEILALAEYIRKELSLPPV